jgi:amidase
VSAESTDDALTIRTAPLETIARAVRAKTLTATEVAQAYLAAIATHNPLVNAIVTLNREQCLEEMRSVDRATADHLGALAGLPFTVKDAIETAGLRTTAGISMFASHVPSRDAPAVAAFRGRGASVLGKTNVPPLNGGFDTVNRLFGRTNNPADLRRSPGGSSGGSAAAVAAGLSAFDVASDSAGSMIIPAHFCGVCAHKPTPSRIPAGGHIPPYPGSRGRPTTVVVGVLARTGSDLRFLVSSVLQPNESTAPVRSSTGETTIALWLDDDVFPVDHAVSAAIRKATERLPRNAYRVSVVENAPELRAFAECCAQLVGADNADLVPTFVAEQNAVRRASSGVEFDLGREVARGAMLSHREWLHLCDRRSALQDQLAELFLVADVVICPPCSTTAFEHVGRRRNGPRYVEVNGAKRPLADVMAWSAISTVGAVPATVVPVGASDGLPIGAQVLAPPGGDELALRVAADLSGVSEFGWREPVWESMGDAQ